MDALGAEARLCYRERSFSFGVGSLCHDGLGKPGSQTRPALSGGLSGLGGGSRG